MIGDRLAKYRDLGLLIFRLGFGLGFLFFHGWEKLAGGPELWAEVGSAVSIFGINFGHAFFGFMAAFSEAVGGLFIAAGLLYRPMCALLATTMLVAMLRHITSETMGPPAHAVKNFFVLVGLMPLGPGKYSLDNYCSSRCSWFKSAAPLLLLLALPHVASAQHGTVHDNLAMTSEILDSERKYAVYLPPDYVASERSYPVLYLLHGAGDDQTGWVQFGEVLHIADKAIREGKATPMVIIMPDANAGQRGYFNDVTGAWRYEDFFFEELMPHVEEKFRIKSEKRYRAVAGLSMGGGGSFMYALHRPDLFSSAAPLSAYAGPRSVDQLKAQAQRRGTDLSGVSDADLESYVNHHSAVALIESLPAEDISSVRWFIDCGDDDFLYEGNSLVHIALRKRAIPHEFRIRDGGHTWTYWRESLPVVLAFVSQRFHQY